MRRIFRRIIMVKIRYVLTVILLIGTSSFITWMQTNVRAGGEEHENAEKSFTKQPTATKPSSFMPVLNAEKKGVVIPPTMKTPKANLIQPPLEHAVARTLAPVSELEKQEYYQEFFKSEVFQASDRKQKPSNGKFLLPVLFFDVGPNNLYRLFKEAIPIAKAMDRTLVIPPFHRHPRMENYVRGKRVGKGCCINKGSQALPEYHSTTTDSICFYEGNSAAQPDRLIEVPIFDQTYVVGLETNPSKSFDMKALRYLVPVESMDRFSKGCAGEATTLLICGKLDEKRRKGIELFQTATKMQFHHMVEVESLSDITEHKTWKVNLNQAIKFLGSIRCAGIAIGRNCLGSKESWLKQYKTIAPFVRRPVPVKILAKKFVIDMMGNQDFLAIHWRYDQIDWNDMCKPNRPESAKKRNAQICQLASKLESEEGALLQMGKKIVRYMRNHGFRKAYFAGPPQMNSTIHKLRSRTPGLFTMHDVREYAELRSSSAGFFETNYMMSFLEQEICYLSKTFLASPLSSWSQSVLLDRMSENKAYASVLDVLVDGVQGLPKLTWLFPEGS